MLAAFDAMRVHAQDVLEHGTAQHLVGNACSPYFAMFDVPELAMELPPMLQSLRDRIALDRQFRAAHPTYPHAYPAVDVTDRLTEEMAEIWARAGA